MRHLRLTLIALIAVAVSLAVWLTPPAPPTPRPALACLTPALAPAIRADPATFDAHYAACRDEVLTLLGDASDAEGALMFASLVAHQLAPYGLSLAYELDVLLAEPQLDCDNYAWLTMLLWRESAHAEGRVRMVVWEHPALGVHAQVVADFPDGRALLLDPTTNMVARVSLAEAFGGRGVASEAIILLPDRNAALGARPHYVAALQLGMLTPDHLILLSDDPTPQMEETARLYANP